MKFPSQHRKFKGIVSNRSQMYGAHRDGNKVWVTDAKGGRVIVRHVFMYVSQAKAWLNMPSLTFTE